MLDFGLTGKTLSGVRNQIGLDWAVRGHWQRQV